MYNPRESQPALTQWGLDQSELFTPSPLLQPAVPGGLPSLPQGPTGPHHMIQAWEEGPSCGRSCWPGTESTAPASQENQLHGKQASSSGSPCDTGWTPGLSL